MLTGIQNLENYQVVAYGTVQFLVISVGLMAMKYSKNFNYINRLFTQMERIPRSKIATTTSGFHEIEGIAHTPSKMEITSPISKQPCLFWSVEVIQIKNGHREKVRRSDSPFFIKDNTGVILICPGKFTDVQFAPTNTLTHEVTKVFVEANRDFLCTLGMQIFPGIHYVRETIIRVDKQLYATGNVAKLPGKSQSSMAKCFTNSDLDEVRSRLSRAGYRVTTSSLDEADAVQMSVSGKKLISRNLDTQIQVECSEEEGSCHYMYGTPESPLFLSSITESMLERDDYVEIYKVPESAKQLWSYSFMLMIAAAITVFWL